MTPDEFTNQEFFLDVGDGHQLYVHDWGNSKAKTPIIFLHGGPGSGTKDKYKSTYDPAMHRVIFFDQRGSGKSLPYGSLENNTTDYLVDDIKKIIDRLELKEVILSGGSWGSCLALAFGLKHPRHVKSMVLRGIFTGSKSEIAWISKGLFKDFFPDVWQDLLKNTPTSHQNDPFGYHEARILGDDEAAGADSAYVIGNVEGALMSLDDRFYPADRSEYDPTFVRLETHYLANNCFMPDRYILDNAHKLKMPIWLIQGRYDMVCPPTTAYELNQKLPNSQLMWTVAGHSNDRPNYDVNRTILLQILGDD